MLKAKIKKERLSKKTNRKQNFKKFVESGYSDIKLFLKACNHDENLLIYTCLEPEELNEVISKMKKFDILEEYIKEFISNQSIDNKDELQNIVNKIKELDILDPEIRYFVDNYSIIGENELKEIISKMKNFNRLESQIKYLVGNQPIMNKDEKRFNKVVDSLYSYLKGYIDYNAFRLSNSTNSAEDWSAELWEKYCKICDFYRIRWFKPEKLIDPKTKEAKKTKVTFTPMLYKEFIYIVRLSISSERKHRAFLAAMHPEDTIFKISLNGKIDVGNDEKSLAEVVPDESTGGDTLVENSNALRIIDKALYIAGQYPDAAEVLDQIKTYYEIQDTEIIDPITKQRTYLDKKIVVLGKIFLYKAGLVSPKCLAFIKALSPTYKQRYNISNARINAQLSEYKTKKPIQKQKKINKKELTYKELILRKRGEL